METITSGSAWVDTRPSGRFRTTMSSARLARGAAERELRTLLDRTEGERPWRIRDELGRDDARELRRLPARGPDAGAGEIVQDLRERYERVVVEDKGDVFNTDLTQALELGYLLELAGCMVARGSRARRAAAHTRARTTTRPRRRELPQAHTR